MKIGDKVVMNNKYRVSEENKGKVWTVRSEPWECCGTLVVLLEGKSGGYAVDGLDIVETTGLTEAEHNAVIEDINRIYPTVINQLVNIADKHNIVRDDLIVEFGKIFSAMAEISTFENWEVERNA